MLNIAKQTIEFYTKFLKTPTINDIKFEDEKFLKEQGCVFVTIYKNGEIRGSSGNIKEIESSLVGEIIQNTINAISKDERFSPLKLNEIKNLKIRIDLIKDRKVLQEKEFLNIDPTKNGILAIKKDYEKMALILPNINAKILTGEDFIPFLEGKFGEKKFDENDYILYSIQTEVFRN